jgi:hypothetical protein
MQTFFSSVVADIALRLGRVNKLEIQHETPRFSIKGQIINKNQQQKHLKPTIRKSSGQICAFFPV